MAPDVWGRSVASWPATLPQLPLAADYSDALADTLVRTQMDVGPAKVRRRTTAGVRAMTASFVLDDTQVGTLVTFYDTTLDGGAQPFDWVLPRTGAAASCRFLQPPVFASPNNGRYRVTCQLEILP